MGARKPKKIEETGAEPQAKGEKIVKTPKVTVKKEPATKVEKKAEKKVRGKNYQAVIKNVAPEALPLAEAIKRVKELSYAKFDAAVDLHVRLGITAGLQEQQIRTFVALPHGTGKKVKVLVFAEPTLVAKAEAAGADLIGSEEMIEEIAKGKIPQVDAIIATPSYMPKIAKAARILGPKGLMPTPKTGTVTPDPAKAVAEIKKGKVEVKTGDQPLVHVSVGKVSFDDGKLAENVKAIIAEINRVRPAKIKGIYIQAAHLAPTMGPSVKLDLSSL